MEFVRVYFYCVGENPERETEASTFTLPPEAPKQSTPQPPRAPSSMLEFSSRILIIPHLPILTTTSTSFTQFILSKINPDKCKKVTTMISETTSKVLGCLLFNTTIDRDEALSVLAGCLFQDTFWIAPEPYKPGWKSHPEVEKMKMICKRTSFP